MQQLGQPHWRAPHWHSQQGVPRCFPVLSDSKREGLGHRRGDHRPLTYTHRTRTVHAPYTYRTRMTPSSLSYWNHRWECLSIRWA